MIVIHYSCVVLLFLQNISAEESNCDKIAEFRVYLLAPGDSNFNFLGVESGLSRVIQNIDPLHNYTVGISAINNAGLESVMTEAVYIGSEYCTLSERLVKLVNMNNPMVSLKLFSFLTR